NFIDNAHAYIDEYGDDSTEAAIQLYKGLLKPASLEYVHAEQVQTAEIGYQCLLADKKLHLDIDFFGSQYIDLIAYQWAVLAGEGNPYTEDSLHAAAAAMLDGGGFGNTTGMNVPVNAPDVVRSGGVEASVEYDFWRDYTLTGNFIYQKT